MGAQEVCRRQEIKGCLRWLNTVLAACECIHLPNHGKRKVAAHKLKLGK